mmetsp:Transcript_34491/g.109526  ORF Transcript_34491/g.109526 Transcript_34491/m.109526 type:complete len:426 (+) Transcript_34491:176-1453(+)
MEAVLNTGTGTSGRIAALPFSSCTSALLAALQSSQPRSPASSPPFSADWHSETARQTPAKPTPPSASSRDNTSSISDSASSSERCTAFLRTGSIGRAVLQCRRRIWRTRNLPPDSPTRCRLAAGPAYRAPASEPAVAGPSLAQAAASGPLAPHSRNARRSATLAARGRPRRRCGVAAAAALLSSPSPLLLLAPMAPATRVMWSSCSSPDNASPRLATVVGADGSGADHVEGGGAGAGEEEGATAAPEADGPAPHAMVARLKHAPGAAAVTTCSPIANTTAALGRTPPWSAARSSSAPMRASWSPASIHSPRKAPSRRSSFICSPHAELSAGAALLPAAPKTASIAAGLSRWSRSTLRASAARCRSGMATCRGPDGCAVALTDGNNEPLVLPATEAPALPPCACSLEASCAVAAPLKKLRGSASPS